MRLLASVVSAGLPASAAAQGASLAGPQTSYRIIGEIAGLSDGARVYLINGGERRTLDSTVARGGRFVLAGRLTEPAHVYLHWGRGAGAIKLADLLLDNRTLSVRGAAPVYDSVLVSGSDIDAQWKAWYRDDQRLGVQRYRVRQVGDSLAARGDAAGASKLLRVAADLQAFRVDLLKEYVRRYRDTAAGAALPTLCTLGPSLTGEDYREMYTALAPAWRDTYFGRETLRAAEARSRAGAP